MKRGNQLKENESFENSLKVKSTNENTKISDKMKSTQQSQKISEIPSIKKGKNIILYLKNKEKINNKIINNKLNDSKQNKKYDSSKPNTNSNLRKIISSQRNSKTLFKTKTENNFNNYDIKKKRQINLSHSPDNIYKKEKKSILITNIPKTKNIKRNINSQRTYQYENYINRNSNESLNTNKNIKNQNIQNIHINLKNSSKNRKKLSFDFTYSKFKLSLKEINFIKKNYTPPIKHYIKKIYEKKNNNLNKKYNKNLNNKNRKIIHDKYSNKNKLGLIVENNNKDKSELIDKMKKKKFIFSTLVYKNKRESIRNNIISLSNNKNIYSYTIPRRKQYYNSKNKIMDEFNDTNNSIYNKRLNITIDRISTNKLKERLNCTTQRIKRDVKTENDNVKKKLLSNDTIQRKKNLHYLQTTVSALNKMVNYKNKENKNKTINFINQKRSKTIEKDIKSLKKKNKDKNNNNNKYYLIHRNTISRFKSREKNTIKIENKSINNISNSNYFSLPNKTKLNNNKIDDYEIIKELGKGSYAKVKLVINKNNKNKFAMKIYSKKSLLDPQKNSTVKNEINILKQLDNINIMKLHDVIETTKYLYLIMEFIDGISLLDTIKKEENHYFEEQRAIKIFTQIIKANIYCQSKNICHRDLKLENILIIKNDIIKLIDFGFAVKTDKETLQNLFCGSPSYMAPEIVNKEKYIAQYSDIWSLGVLFYSMLYGRFPFLAKNQNELFKKINEAQVEFPDEIEVNEKIKILLKKIFVIIPAQRPSLQEILNDILLLIN